MNPWTNWWQIWWNSKLKGKYVWILGRQFLDWSRSHVLEAMTINCFQKLLCLYGKCGQSIISAIVLLLFSHRRSITCMHLYCWIKTFYPCPSFLPWYEHICQTRTIVYLTIPLTSLSSFIYQILLFIIQWVYLTSP